MLSHGRINILYCGLGLLAACAQIHRPIPSPLWLGHTTMHFLLSSISLLLFSPSLPLTRKMIYSYTRKSSSAIVHFCSNNFSLSLSLVLPSHSSLTHVASLLYLLHIRESHFLLHLTTSPCLSLLSFVW